MPSKRMLRAGGAVGLGLALLVILIVAGKLGRNRGQASREVAMGISHPGKMLSLASPMSMKADRSYAPLERVAHTGDTESEEAIQDSDSSAGFPFDRQKLIWTGNLSMEVQDTERAITHLGSAARELGGYLTGTQLERQPSGVRTGEVVMRIPASQFNRAGDSIRGLGKILSESSNVADVTKAYADLQARLQVKRETERRVRDLLAHRTGTLKDVLEAEKELARIRGEIDTMEGERRWYEHQVRFSNITVRLQEPVPIGLSRPSAWAPLVEAFRDAAGNLADSLAFLFRGLVYLVPWALGGLLAFGILRRFRRPSSQAAADS